MVVMTNLLVLNKLPFFQAAADAAKSAMVSIIGLDSEKVQQLCDAANQEVDEADKVQIANYLCPVIQYHLSLHLKPVKNELHHSINGVWYYRVTTQSLEVSKESKLLKPKLSHSRHE